ncbi:MAG TPA: NAD(P)/FAD-dependent oxidoreductase [Stellaceae bacterium]|nr:NAD(P)/FAD-dependent oxidoreductase [Stellaceae bacterium]
MSLGDPAHVVVVGAGAAGLMAACELARAGRRVTILEARDRCGGRIYPLPEAEFGYRAEGGAEFVHGAAVVTRALMREAGLSLAPRHGTRWSTRTGVLAPAEPLLPHADRFYDVLLAVKEDLPVAEFLDAHFAAPRYDELRRWVTRTVEGYDAADPHRFSTIALRDEWLARDDGEHGRIREGYGALIAYLEAECRGHGAAIHLGAEVTAIDEAGERIALRCADGAGVEADAAILAVPLPLLSEIALPPSACERVGAAADIGFGNVIKLLLRFATPWWASLGGRNLADLSFLLSNAPVPTWWTQHPDPHPVLTGWLAGPKADRISPLGEGDIVEMGLASLAEIFDLPADRLRGMLVASRAIDWGNDPFARGAYSYVTPKTRAALSLLRRPDPDGIFISGEALYAGPDMRTVEAALASGQETARTILRGSLA